MDLGKATIVAAIIGVIGIPAIEFAKKGFDGLQSVDAATPGAELTCDPIPPVAASPPPKVWEKHVWVPPDFVLTAGRLEAVAGHWERSRADGKNTYIPGHWDKETGRCVWVRGGFAGANGIGVTPTTKSGIND